MAEHKFQKAGFNLFADQCLFNGWKSQNNSQHRGQRAVAPEDLIINNKVLKLAALNGHDSCPMNGI